MTREFVTSDRPKEPLDTTFVISPTLPRSPHTAQAEHFQVKLLYAPALLLGVGLWGTIDNSWLHRQERSLNHSLNGHSNWKRIRVDDMLQYLPMISYQGLAIFPQIARSHSLRERLLLHATAAAIMASIVNLSKHTLNKPRPDLAANNSFPSGHTATAFLGAELTRIEYGKIYGWSSYGIATSVAGMRMYNKRHWLSDVLAGAGVGILSARIAYWLLPWQRSILGWEEKKYQKKKNNVIVVPSYDVSQRTPQVHISLSF